MRLETEIPADRGSHLHLELLYALNAIDDRCKLAQGIGTIIAQMPCDPRMAAMLIASGERICSEEILSIDTHSPRERKGNI